VVTVLEEASRLATRLAFGEVPVRVPFTTAVVGCYAEAK
jgi:DNA polymerase-1